MVASRGLGRHHGRMDADDLYGLPLERFVPERGALARALRADARRDEAAGVAALRKPSVAAWAVNQLVRTQARVVTELFDAGDALREAQADLLAGRGDGRALRAAGQNERATVDALVIVARGLLTSEGQDLSAATIEKVADTLHAAALDDDARRAVRDGRLERELRHVGLGIGDLPEATLARPPAKRKAPAREKPARAAGTDGAEAKSMARERAEAQRVERERAKARKAAQAGESAARRLADRAARALSVAEGRRERAASALRDADEALAAAREEVEAATDAHRRAQQELETI
jgi:hypothetical protein